MMHVGLSVRHNLLYLLWRSKLDGPLVLWVNLAVVDTVHLLSNKFVTGVKIKATGESKLMTALACYKFSLLLYLCHRK